MRFTLILTGWILMVHGPHAALLAPWAGVKLTGEPEHAPPFMGVPGFSLPSPGAQDRWDRSLTAVDAVPPHDAAPRRLYALEIGGKAWTLRDEPEADGWETFFELRRDGVQLYSLAFDPQFPQRPFVYAMVNESKRDGKMFKNRDVVLRLTVTQLEPPKAGAVGAVGIISWEAAGHNGGDIKFGPDGMLWISSGDGQNPGDPRYIGQTTDDFLGTILRIDVRETTPEVPYRVPPDNPFVNTPGATPETWCYGLRNPWKIEFNHATGELFIGDNGEDSWEMVRVARKGGNGGWSVFEGSHPFRPTLKLLGPSTGLMKPVVEHPHTEIRSVIGGVFYRGKKFPELAGRYIYGDYCTGTLWSFAWKDGTASKPELLANTSLSITDIAEDHEGELLIGCREGQVLRIERTPPRAAVPTLAKRLGETGLFSAVKDLAPAAGSWPYDVIAPAWHDGAVSARFIAMPPGGKLAPSDDDKQTDNFELPDGAVAVQTLNLNGRRIETRVIFRHDHEDWSFYSYAWNKEQTDADLIPAEGADQFIETSAEHRDNVKWHVPSRLECMTCHTWPGKRVIGLNPAQLNRLAPAGAPEAGKNQLALLNEWRLFTKPLKRPPDQIAKLSDPADEGAPLEARCRAVLHANCAHCHRSGGAGGGKPDYRLPWWFSLDETGIINSPPLAPMYGLTDARLIAPGSPEKSMIYRRMITPGPGHMPLLGAQKIDTAAVAILKRWIESLK